jgi:nitroimidazol reductase NimA-like FMN-containing flavoprotein (pyridoxamine 5'-phosphate oxidase superfamily)
MDQSKDKSADSHEFEVVAGKALVGHLGINTPDGYPRVVPLNFVADGQIIYFHGAHHGEMCEVLKTEPKVTFSIDRPYSVIPSYWISKISAAASTMFYKSILVKGRAVVVDDIDEKIRALSLLTKKYQPEGGYRPIKEDEPAYNPILKNTMVYRIDTDRIDIRINFHQKKNSAHKKKLIHFLEERGQGPDIETAAILKEML